MLCDAVRIRVRYHTKADRNHPDKILETRSEYNERFGQSDKTPEIDVPDHGLYLWDWYFDLSERLKRVHDGSVVPIPPSEQLAWTTLTGEIVYPHEYAILSAMDDAFCSAMSEELEAQHKRDRERAKRKG